MSIFSDKLRVGVLRGGPSHEYHVSLGSGASVIENLPKDIYEPIDIFISKEGIWHENGYEKSLDKIIRSLDVVFNALRGKYGEDGTIQKTLDNFSIPYTGSGRTASILGINKIASKKIYNKYGLKTPFGVSINLNNLSRQSIADAYKRVPYPFVVKPASSGSSFGVGIAYSLPDLEELVVSAFEYSPSVLIEEYIQGKEVTCGVIDHWRGNKHHALLPVEIIHKNQNDFFDYNSKYSNGGFEEICPGLFSENEKKDIENYAVVAHDVFGLRHYSRSDFRVHPKRGVFILETNTLPSLSKNSLITKALKATGAKLSDFLHHIISLALKK